MRDKSIHPLSLEIPERKQLTFSCSPGFPVSGVSLYLIASLGYIGVQREDRKGTAKKN